MRLQRRAELPVIYTLDNNGDLDRRRRRARRKGILGRTRRFASTTSRASGQQGDLYSGSCSSTSTLGRAIRSSAGELDVVAPVRRPATEGVVASFSQPVRVGIMVLACDPGSQSKQEAPLVRDVG